jgi:putative ABC transport system permease protein
VSDAIGLDVGQVAASLVLVAMALAISAYERVAVERDIGLAVVRSALQLTAVGFVIDAIFAADSLAFAVLLLAVMVVVGALTARGRARAVPNALGALLPALALAAGATVALVVALGIFDATPRYLVPVGGMVIGNAMTAAAVALDRLGEGVRTGARDVEAALALGATARQAARPVVRRSLRSAMIPIVDQTKTTGIVAFPGTMVGMLLAGADPLDAVKLQLVLLWVLLGGVAIAALVAATLATRRLFTPAHQIVEAAPPTLDATQP